MKKKNNLPLILIGSGIAYMLFVKKKETTTNSKTPVIIKPQPQPQPQPVPAIVKTQPQTLPLPQPVPVVVKPQPQPQPQPQPLPAIDRQFPKGANAPVVKPPTPVNPTATTTVTVTSSIAAYEGKFINDTKTGTAYKVINGKLYYLKNWSEVGGVKPFAYSGLITGWPIAGSYADLITKLNVTPALKTPATPANTIPKQIVDVQKPGGNVQQQINITKPTVQPPILLPVANQTPGLVTTAGKVLSILNGTPIGQTGGNVSKTTVTSNGNKR